MEGQGGAVPFFLARNKSAGPAYVTFFFQIWQIFKALLERWVFSMPKILLAKSQYRFIGGKKLGTLGDALSFLT